MNEISEAIVEFADDIESETVELDRLTDSETGEERCELEYQIRRTEAGAE